MQLPKKVKIKRLCKTAVIPAYAKPGDAGMDLICTDITVTPDYIQYHTGLAMEIPEGYVGLLFPRSSNSNKDLLLCNSVGVIDSIYRGELMLRYKYVEADPERSWSKLYDRGDKVGQLLIIPYPQITFEEVDKLSDTARGVGGFGSTGA
jgi:dUTP pyrophosphatase